VMGFTVLVSLLTGVVFGLAPALHASKADLTQSLKEGGRSSSEGGQPKHLRSALVIVEVSLALILLVGAGLLIKTLLRLRDVAPGFDTHNLSTLAINLPAARYGDQQVTAFYEQLLSRIESLPRVSAASAVNPLPLGGAGISIVFDIEGNPLPKSEQPQTEYRAINPGYFRTMGIPLVTGRDFTLTDNQEGRPVVIINETLAHRFFPDENPIGKHIKPAIAVDSRGPLMREVVGIVGDVRHKNLQTESGPELYVPHAQIPFRAMTVIVRTDRDIEDVARAVRGEVKGLDANLPIYNINRMDRYMAQALSQSRFNALLLATFAAVALILSAVGFYALVSYSVAQRTHEIGIRMALGASSNHVFALVIRQGMALALIGIAVGLVSAAAMTRLVSSLLYGVSGLDPTTFAGVSSLLALVALVACVVPAQRAMKVDPMIALRHE
jgi:putative ABC transport system permease protein